MKKLFPGQQEDEQICLIIRQHWSIFARHLLSWLVFLGILVIMHFGIKLFLPDFFETPYIQVINLAETIYLMFLAVALLMMWVLYYLNVQIVTNRRVVDITQKGLLTHTISEVNLGRIQDVTAEIHGFWETFLNYGNVYLQTAGEMERFEFQRVGNPTSVAKMILDLYEKLPSEEKHKE